jgi:hypothetical protein
MGRRLKLTKSQLTEVNFDFLGAFRLRVDVTDPTDSGADTHVFLYNLRPTNPYDESQVADFMAIASPGDLAEYPPGEPNGNTTHPFFRLDYVELDFRSTEQANETWALIVAEVDALLKSLDRMEQLVPVVEVWVGDQTEEGASESASNSTSNSV